MKPVVNSSLIKNNVKPASNVATEAMEGLAATFGSRPKLEVKTASLGIRG